MDVEAIRQSAKEVRQGVENKKAVEDLRVLHAQFAGLYPRLFDACCDVNFDLVHLEFIMKTMKSVGDEEIAITRADRIVYDHLNSHFIDSKSS